MAKEGGDTTKHERKTQNNFVGDGIITTEYCYLFNVELHYYSNKYYLSLCVLFIILKMISDSDKLAWIIQILIVHDVYNTEMKPVYYTRSELSSDKISNYRR